MRALKRFAVPFAAAIGLMVVFAPTASAGCIRPVIQTVKFASAFTVYSPCNGNLIDTTGRAQATTVTTGQRTAITVADSEAGDGYRFVELGAAAFSTLASEYSVPAEGLWINVRDPALSFHASLLSVVNVTGTNAPTGFNTSISSYACGI